MNKGQGFDGFQFDDHPVGDHDVRAGSVGGGVIFVDGRDPDLAAKRDAGVAEFQAQAAFVCRFQQALAEGGVYFHGQIDDAAGRFVVVAYVDLLIARRASYDRTVKNSLTGLAFRRTSQ